MRHHLPGREDSQLHRRRNIWLTKEGSRVDNSWLRRFRPLLLRRCPRIESLPEFPRQARITARRNRRAHLRTKALNGEIPTGKIRGSKISAKSPRAKLRDIPVRAVTIQSGFWAQRREINVTKSIPTMHDLLEVNGRMNNFRRLTGKSQATADRTGVFRLRCLQVDRSSRVRASVGRPPRAPGNGGENDCRGSCRPGTQRLLEYLLSGRTQVRTNVYPDPDHRSRALQHWTYAARSDRLLPRHGRPHVARCRNPFRR